MIIYMCVWVCECTRLCRSKCDQVGLHWWSQAGWIIESDTGSEWANAHSHHKVKMRTWVSEKFGDRGYTPRTYCVTPLPAGNHLNNLLNHNNPKILWPSHNITSLHCTAALEQTEMMKMGILVKICLCKTFQHTIHTALLLSYMWEDWKKCLPSPCNYYCSNTICKLLSWCYNGLTSSNHAGVIYNSTRAAEVPLLLPTHRNSKWAHNSPSLCVTLSVCLSHSFSLSVLSVSVTLSLSELDNSTHS